LAATLGKREKSRILAAKRAKKLKKTNWSGQKAPRLLALERAAV
jgi:hypothetical protein